MSTLTTQPQQVSHNTSAPCCDQSTTCCEGVVSVDTSLPLQTDWHYIISVKECQNQAGNPIGSTLVFLKQLQILVITLLAKE